jgi:hypothetical protein
VCEVSVLKSSGLSKVQERNLMHSTLKRQQPPFYLSLFQTQICL